MLALQQAQLAALEESNRREQTKARQAAKPTGPLPPMPAAGWYPDHKDPASGRLRWWDGTAWTRYVRLPKDGKPASTTGEPPQISARKPAAREG
jgi:hypothetical protein